MDSERFREQALEHLLHGLEGTELEEFEAELRRRGEAGELELARLRETVAAVALGAPPIEPPPALKARLLSRIVTEGEGAEVIGLRREPRARWWIGTAALAASVALILGFWNVQLRRDLEGLSTDLSAAREGLAAADSLRGELNSLRDDIMTITSPEASAITLTGTAERPEARARAFVDPLTGRALIFVYELPILPPDSVYQLWAIRGQSPVDAGTFSVGADRRARLPITDAGIVLGADALAVTIEPAPGGPAPTGPIILSSTL